VSDAARPGYLEPQQLALQGMTPAPGERWRNVNTGSIAVVLRLEQRSYGWVTIRIVGSEQTLTIANFLRHFTPHQPTQRKAGR
jgi:hypothetical protein